MSYSIRRLVALVALATLLAFAALVAGGYHAHAKPMRTAGWTWDTASFDD
jgi:hypothetical protein